MSKLNETELRQLALKIRDGDQKAMTHFYEQTIHIVYGMVKSKVYNEEDAKDVVQDIYISFYTSIKSYDEQRPFVSWFVSLINARVIDCVRTIYRRRAETALEDAPVADIIKDMLDTEHTKAEIRRLIEELPKAQRDILYSFYIEDKSVNQVMDEYDLTKGAVTSALSKGRNSLRLLLIAEDEQDNKLYGMTLVPMIDMFNKGLQSKPAVKMPAKMTLQVFDGIAKSTGIANAGSISTTMGVLVMTSTAAKIAIGVVAVAIVGTAVAVPVYIHNENEKEKAAVMAMAAVDLDEQSEIEVFTEESMPTDVTTYEESGQADDSDATEQLSSEIDTQENAEDSEVEVSEGGGLLTEEQAAEQSEAEAAAQSSSQSSSSQDGLGIPGLITGGGTEGQAGMNSNAGGGTGGYGGGLFGNVGGQTGQAPGIANGNDGSGGFK